MHVSTPSGDSWGPRTIDLVLRSSLFRPRELPTAVGPSHAVATFLLLIVPSLADMV